MSAKDRLRFYLLSESEIRDAFNFWQAPMYVRFKEGLDIPPQDAELVKVNYLWGRRAFAFLMRHDSFEEVSFGAEIPVMPNAVFIQIHVFKLVEINGKWYYEVPEYCHPCLETEMMLHKLTDAELNDANARMDAGPAIQPTVEILNTRLSYEERQKYACDVCSNVPDEYGVIEHGRGCYTQSENGGGTSLVDFTDE